MSDSRPSSAVQVIWRYTPPTPAQLQAWRQLWARLLGDVDPTPAAPQPRDHGSTGAATVTEASTQVDALLRGEVA
jgi:hypothetical protein